jgi:hypothetical protein
MSDPVIKQTTIRASTTGTAKAMEAQGFRFSDTL